MSAYSIEYILLEYEHDRMKVEMALGHGLQHIQKLYEAQTAANVSRYELRSKVEDLEAKVSTLQATVDRLKALVDKFLPKS